MTLERGDPGGLSRHELDFNAWAFWRSADGGQRQAQRAFQQGLVDRGIARLAEGCFVSELAACFPDELVMGTESYIAAFAYVTGTVHVGHYSTVNPYTVVRGDVRIGDGVRIGAHTSILGFNHSMRADRPVFEQPIVSNGITIGDDVWIGSNVVIVDGVSVGDHSVIGAGAVVTKDVEPWSVMAGNPARRLRDRRDRKPARADTAAAPTPGGEVARIWRQEDVANRVAEFGRTVRDQASDVLARCWEIAGDGQAGRFVDRPGAEPTMRAWCDAIEIADLLLNQPPPQAPADQVVEMLRSAQDPNTGLVAEHGDTEVTMDGHDLGGGRVRYHILAVGYALDLLGSAFLRPITAVDAISRDELVDTLEALPWAEKAWAAGDWIDCYATGLYWNHRRFGQPGALDTLIGWLHTQVDPSTGMWGQQTTSQGRRQIVNGYYRIARGTFARFGLQVPHPELVIDTVLTHTRDRRWFGAGRGDACNVLDVINPLWLAGIQSNHRRDEVQRWAHDQLDRVIAHWRPGAGFSFGLERGPGFAGEPGLQGTEMWLAITWYLADTIGQSHVLGYTPHGVHNPDIGLG